ncbi:MAG TPA: HAD family phosphatase [Acidimicrobiales bacterium]|nr:HAD family phosphatase [Acidimicrobiales bacterium]
MIDAVVFDFDGLIVDTESSSFRAWVETYEEYGCTLVEEDWAQHIGTINGFDPYGTLCARATLPVPPEGELRAAKRAREQELVEAEPVRPGVVAWLDEVATMGLPVAIASSSPTHWITGHLTRLNFTDRFAVVACCDDDRPPKPAPDVYLAACERLDVAPSRSLAIEDSAHGVAAAKAAGLWCVAVPGPLTRTLDFSAADITLGSLADVPLADVLGQLDPIAR